MELSSDIPNFRMANKCLFCSHSEFTGEKFYCNLYKYSFKGNEIKQMICDSYYRGDLCLKQQTILSAL